jgi:hypothetical protein
MTAPVGLFLRHTPWIGVQMAQLESLRAQQTEWIPNDGNTCMRASERDAQDN